jgi:hypothetical protein
VTARVVRATRRPGRVLPAPHAQSAGFQSMRESAGVASSTDRVGSQRRCAMRSSARKTVRYALRTRRAGQYCSIGNGHCKPRDGVGVSLARLRAVP